MINTDNHGKIDIYFYVCLEGNLRDCHMHLTRANFVVSIRIYNVFTSVFLTSSNANKNMYDLKARRTSDLKNRRKFGLACLDDGIWWTKGGGIPNLNLNHLLLFCDTF